MHGNIVTLCGMSSFVMLSEDCLFKEKGGNNRAACREGLVSQGADMKVYLEGFEKHRETGGVLRQKNTVNLFTRTVVSHAAPMQRSCSTLCFSDPAYILQESHLQDIVSGSWSPPRLAADREPESSPASASGSTCAQ